jgi:hypothetical protein
MRRLAAAALAAASMVGFAPEEALAERSVQFIEGFRCEIHSQGILAKSVCRDPADPQGRWFVCWAEQAPTGMLTNCFGPTHVALFRNDGPILYAFPPPGVSAYNDRNGWTCQLRAVQSPDGFLGKTACFPAYGAPSPWYTCIYENRPGGGLFSDCVNNDGREWSEEVPGPPGR